MIFVGLHEIDEEKLLRVLKDNKKTFGWSIHDIKGLDPIICTHRINIEEGFPPKQLPQKRHNSNMMEVVKGEVIKLLDASIIYLIFDSPWVSLVQCVPKKKRHHYDGKWAPWAYKCKKDNQVVDVCWL